MSVNTYMENLERRHAVLDDLINIETGRPLPDFVKITKMKKKKLQIKERLSKFGSEVA